MLMEASSEEWYVNSPLNNYVLVVERNFNYFFLLGSKHYKSTNLLTITWEIFLMLIGYFFKVYAEGKSNNLSIR